MKFVQINEILGMEPKLLDLISPISFTMLYVALYQEPYNIFVNQLDFSSLDVTTLKCDNSESQIKHL
jgi:hypothetical protein